MSTKSKLKPLKEIGNCPLACQRKGTNRCRRTSCQELDLHLKILPCYICPPACQYKGTPRCNKLFSLILNEYLKPESDPCRGCPLLNKKFCKVNCDKVTQWNSAWEWRQNVDWDNKRLPIPNSEDITGPEKKPLRIPLKKLKSI